MCDFCECLIEKDKEIVWSVRSTYADDNVREIINDEKKVVGETMKFTMNGHLYKGNTFVSIEYRQELTIQNKEEIIISPFSEAIQFNFCPICGSQISDRIKDFDNYYNHQIAIYDVE